MQRTINPISYPVPKPVYKRIKKNVRILMKKVIPPAVRLVYKKVRMKFFPYQERIYLNTMDGSLSWMKVSENCYEAINEDLKLQPGEWIEVRSWKEISRTFDGAASLKGLGFMAGMEEYCGKRFRVYKKVQKIRLETTGEMRKLKNPAILLEGVFCNGKHYEGCDRSCFYFWREAWLKRINEVKQLLLYIISYIFVESEIDTCCCTFIC